MECVPHLRHEALTGVSQQHAMPVSHEKSNATEAFFKASDVLTDCTVREVQLLPRSGVAEMTCGSVKRTQALQRGEIGDHGCYLY